jgi:hypothetical protein
MFHLSSSAAVHLKIDNHCLISLSMGDSGDIGQGEGRHQAPVWSHVGARSRDAQAGLTGANRIRSGYRQTAHDLLLPQCQWFTEGFDAPDSVAARAILRKLA